METLKKGSRGDNVKKLQTLLGIKSDGIFGVDTESHVKQFQSKNGLVSDGIVGQKTWDKLLNNKNSVNISKDLVIENHYLNVGQYINGKYKNDYIVLHHTCGWDNPYGVVDSWNSDTIGRVATEFVVGGIRCTDGRNMYDGKIIRTFPEGSQGYHIGKSGSSYMNTHSVGIEMCSMGGIKNGKTYINTTCQPQQIVTLKSPFRGYLQCQRYSDKQLQSVKKLLYYIANRDNIDLHKGLYEWIKKEGVNAFEFHSDAYYGNVKGLITHTNVRKDKSDCFPQQELMDMILSL